MDAVSCELTLAQPSEETRHSFLPLRSEELSETVNKKKEEKKDEVAANKQKIVALFNET